MPKSWERNEFNKMLPLMMAAHPKCFFGKDSPETRPVKYGIHLDLEAAHPELTPAKVRRFLKLYCGKNRYMRALAAGLGRIDLDGNEVAPLLPRDIERGRSILAEREVIRGKERAAIEARAQG